MDWERARRPEQKAVRREAILCAARTLFSELEYDEISLNGIAREAGISKPNVYRYFSTREEIFLAIFAAERESFLAALSVKMKRIRAQDTVEAIARAWVDVALSHPTLLELLPQLSISLERNSSVEQLVEFKRVGHGQIRELVEIVHGVYPTLNHAEWSTVLQCALSMMAGLWPFTVPGENVTEAIECLNDDYTAWDFRTVMTDGLASLIAGTVTRAERATQ